MGIKESYEQAKADYEFLKAHHGGDADDLTGGWVEGEKLFDLLRNPTKTKATEIYWSLIQHSAECGFEGGISVDRDSEEVMAIYERHSCDVW